MMLAFICASGDASAKKRGAGEARSAQVPHALRDIPTYCSAPAASYTAYTPEEAGSSGPTPALRVAGASAPDRASARHAVTTQHQQVQRGRERT